MGAANENRRSPQPDTGRTAWLAQAVQRGDIASFDELYARVAPALHAWASLRAPRGVDPADIAGETWLRAFRSLQTHAAGDHEFRAWIFGVAKNVMLETLRRLGREEARRSSNDPIASRAPFDDYPEHVTSISARLARDEALSALIERVRGFDPIDRELLVHCGLEGSMCTLVATRIGISSEAAKKRWQRLRAELSTTAWVRDLLA
jgi:RNA polymerase sigma-70 factor, ECF subfamily